MADVKAPTKAFCFCGVNFLSSQKLQANLLGFSLRTMGPGRYCVPLDMYRSTRLHRFQEKFECEPWTSQQCFFNTGTTRVVDSPNLVSWEKYIIGIFEIFWKMFVKWHTQNMKSVKNSKNEFLFGDFQSHFRRPKGARKNDSLEKRGKSSDTSHSEFELARRTFSTHPQVVEVAVCGLRVWWSLNPRGFLLSQHQSRHNYIQRTVDVQVN